MEKKKVERKIRSLCAQGPGHKHLGVVEEVFPEKEAFGPRPEGGAKTSSKAEQD